MRTASSSPACARRASGRWRCCWRLSAGTLLINGMLFWITLRPVQKVRAIDHIAINALCTFLAFLPFKIGTLTRVAINNRRDNVPLLTIGAWYGVMFTVMLAAYVPAMGASVWRRGLDATWWAVCLGGAAVLCAALVLVSRLFSGEAGLARLHKVIDGVRLPIVSRLARTDHFERMHTAADMGASPVDMAGGVAFRLLDLGVMSARFVVAGSIVGIAFGWEEAVLVASAYYIIGMLSPFGMLGGSRGRHGLDGRHARAGRLDGADRRRGRPIAHGADTVYYRHRVDRARRRCRGRAGVAPAGQAAPPDRTPGRAARRRRLGNRHHRSRVIDCREPAPAAANTLLQPACEPLSSSSTRPSATWRATPPAWPR
ncbi:MAG: hypothetical protein HND58_18625 [Planctomycetota bacterium]|nr:MAG: hypothetical protein HND58_18625 [Planctomycetota bacterium]